VFDTRPALADMAAQIRSCRAADGLTLQQLAILSGVAASTIHKVESRQMVPTVSVLLKISKGLGRPPEELIRDEFSATTAATTTAVTESSPDEGLSPSAHLGSESGSEPSSKVIPTAQTTGVWQFEITQDRTFPDLKLESLQHAILLVDRGVIDLQTGDRRVSMSAGDCIEIEGGQLIETLGDQTSPAKLTLIVSPAGNLEDSLGTPSAVLPPQTSSAASSASPSSPPSSSTSRLPSGHRAAHSTQTEPNS
jgi:transcriptional regulator with XRE-family HTH domain